MTEAKNVNGSYIFDLRSHVTAKRGNRSEEIAGRGQKNSLCQRNVSWVLYTEYRIEKHCRVKHFAFPENVCYQY